jgi:UDP-N-acetylglucosamine 4-epimerase
LKKVVVTGCAGFIVSHIVESLLKTNHHVIGVDNLWTGTTKNIHEALQGAQDYHHKFEFFESDILDFSSYDGVDCVFHLAALGSVSRSLENPYLTHQANVEGHFHMLNRARKKGVKRIIYASSSSVYGSSIAEPQIEPFLGRSLSPYAATKKINEIYSEAFEQAYQIPCVGLRFFNVYGPRQDPSGSYSAVIPRWIKAMQAQEEIQIYGNGEIKRDFTYVSDVVRACWLAANAPSVMLKLSSVFNVGSGDQTTLNNLFEVIKSLTGYNKKPVYLDERPGDRKSSLADLSSVGYCLGYQPEYSLREGLKETVNYYGQTL